MGGAVMRRRGVKGGLARSLTMEQHPAYQSSPFSSHIASPRPLLILTSTLFSFTRSPSSLLVALSSADLLVFGRLRPDRHIQRVETAAANILFSALDAHLTGTRQTLEQLVASFDVHKQVCACVCGGGMFQLVMAHHRPHSYHHT